MIETAKTTTAFKDSIESTGIGLFELSPLFSSTDNGPCIVACHEVDGAHIIFVGCGRFIWLNYQADRCRPLVKSFTLPVPCHALCYSASGARIAFVCPDDSCIRILNIAQALRGPPEFEEIFVREDVFSELCTWWCDSTGADHILMVSKFGPVFINLVTQKQNLLSLDIVIDQIQVVDDTAQPRILLCDVTGAYFWLDMDRMCLMKLNKFSGGVRVIYHRVPGKAPLFSVYTPSRLTIDLFDSSLKGPPLSSHIVPACDFYFLFDNYIMCISPSKVDIVSLILSDVDFVPHNMDEPFDINLSIMQTIFLPTDCRMCQISGAKTGKYAGNDPSLVFWTSTAVWRLFRAMGVTDVVESVVTAFSGSASDDTLPSISQVSLLALSLAIPVPDFFEFAGDRAWNVEKNFAIAFTFYWRSNIPLHKLSRRCMDAAKICDIVQVVDDILEAREPDLDDHHRSEFSYCQFFCLVRLYITGVSSDDSRLFNFAARSKYLNRRRGLDVLIANAGVNVVLKYCNEHGFMHEYLTARSQKTIRRLSQEELDFFINNEHRCALLANPDIFLALFPQDQLKILLHDLMNVPDILWEKLTLLPFLLAPSDLASLLEKIPLNFATAPLKDVLILCAIRLFDFPGVAPAGYDPNSLSAQLKACKSLFNGQKLIEICMDGNPPLRKGAAMLLEADGDTCGAAVKRLEAATDQDELEFIHILMSELSRIEDVSEQSLLLLLSQQLWEARINNSNHSNHEFADAILPYIDILSPIILDRSAPPAPWVTQALFFQALIHSKDSLIFERDDYTSALERVLASPDLLNVITETNFVDFELRRDSGSPTHRDHPSRTVVTTDRSEGTAVTGFASSPFCRNKRI
uniref:Uncharacterized protein n=1 Tax=Spongospora subterranea TaxID=70186 RepID=A0A0H5QXD7_9EUKA|eukprot:CRZ06605.1 hypothetical protein [Spongospora subterranea]